MPFAKRRQEAFQQGVLRRESEEKINFLSPLPTEVIGTKKVDSKLDLEKRKKARLK